MRILTETEAAALAALRDLPKENRFIAGIKREIDRRVGGNSSMSTLVAALAQLEEKEFAESRSGKPTPGRGGKPKRFYRTTPKGREALEDTVEQWGRLTAETETPSVA